MPKREKTLTWLGQTKLLAESTWQIEFRSGRLSSGVWYGFVEFGTQSLTKVLSYSIILKFLI